MASKPQVLPNSIPIFQPPQEEYVPLGIRELMEGRVQQTDTQPSGSFTPEEWLRLVGATGARVIAPALGTAGGFAVGGPVGALAGGAAMGAAGEAIAQKIEPRSNHELRPGAIAVGGALGAIPGSWMYAPGKMGMSALKGGAIGLGSTVASKYGEGTLDDWSMMDAVPTLLGATTGSVLGRMSNKPVGTPTVPPTGSPATYAQDISQEGVVARNTLDPKQGISHRTIPETDPRISNPSVAPKPPTTVQDLIGGKMHTLAAKGPEDIETAAMKGQALGLKMKLPEQPLDIGGIPVRPDAPSIDSIIEEATGKIRNAPNVLRTAAAETDKAGRDTLSKLAQNSDVEKLALQAEARGDTATALKLRQKAVAEGNASPTTSRAVIKDRNQGIAQEVKNENAREGFIKKGWDQEAKNANAADAYTAEQARQASIANRIAQQTEGMVPQEPSSVIKMTQDLPDGGTETVTQRFARPAPEAGDVDEAVNALGGGAPPPQAPIAPALKLGAPETRTIFPTREAAIRTQDAAGAVGVVKAPNGQKGFVHVFDDSVKPVGQQLENSVAAIGAKAEALEERGAGPIYKQMIKAQSALKSVQEKFPEAKIVKVKDPDGGVAFQVEKGKRAPALKVAAPEVVPPVEQGPALPLEPAAATEGVLPVEARPDTSNLVNPNIDTESIMATRGGTKATPEARDAAPFNVERRVADSAPKAGGLRSTDPQALDPRVSSIVDKADEIIKSSDDPTIIGQAEKEALAHAEAEAATGNAKTFQARGVAQADEQAGISSRLKQQNQVEDENAFVGRWQKLMRSNTDEQLAAVAKMNKPEAQRFLDRLSAAPDGGAGKLKTALEAQVKKPEGGFSAGAGLGGGNDILEIIKNNPDFAARLIGGAVGATGGAILNPDDPAAGAVIGGAGGALLGPAALRANFAKLASNPSTSHAGLMENAANVKQMAARFADMLPEFYRANLLAHPVNLPLNIFAGPWGSMTMAGIEKSLAGDPVGPEILKRVFNPSLLKNTFMDTEIEALDRIAMAEGRAEGLGVHSMQHVNPTVKKLVQAPGVLMTRGDITAQRILAEAGVPELEARTITLTSEPESAFAGAIRGFVQGNVSKGGNRSVIIRMMLPFHRTALNQMEQSLARFPLGQPLYRIMDSLLTGTPHNVREEMAKATLGTGVLATSYFIGYMAPKEARWQIRKVLDNLGGQYGMLASTAFMAGQLAAGGSKYAGIPAAAASIGENDLPIPKFDFFRDAYKAGKFVQDPSVKNIPWTYVPGGAAGKVAGQIPDTMKWLEKKTGIGDGK